MNTYDISQSYKNLGECIEDIILQRDFWKKTAEYIMIELSKTEQSDKFLQNEEYKNNVLDQWFDEANYTSASYITEV
jgi:sortase (surface protein transpeptidase)